MEENYQCCIPSNISCYCDQCRESDYEYGYYYDDQKFYDCKIVCSEGRVLPITSFCENFDRSLQCYHSYEDSPHISDRSHYTCPGHCVPVLDMCHGVKWCESDYDECDEHLRCPPYTTKHTLLNRTDHHFCIPEDFRKLKTENREFDVLDRSDEKDLKFDGSALDINLSQFNSCVTSDVRENQGVMCGSECLSNYKWCGKYSGTCGPLNISTRDWRLCSNPLVFSNISCIRHDVSGRVYAYGQRCTGDNKECIYPWYGIPGGGTGYKTLTCSDKSDQVFRIGDTCQDHLKRHMEDHTSHFCKSGFYWLDIKQICTNKE